MEKERHDKHTNTRQLVNYQGKDMQVKRSIHHRESRTVTSHKYRGGIFINLTKTSEIKTRKQA